MDAPDVVLPRRSRPLCDVPAIGIGNKPIDDGNYLFSAEERDVFIAAEPAATKFFRRWLGADEFINGFERWCLWLREASPAELRSMPLAMQRVQAVKRYREASKSAPTRKIAATPTRFHVEFVPAQPFMVIPEVSSERRRYIPLGFLPADTLASNKLRLLPDATRYHFGVLSSAMHMAWIDYTCGRLKSDYQYSINIVYNNFPWPDGATDAQRAAIEVAAPGVLDARTQFPGSTLADLYDPLAMPGALLKAHQNLDAAVDAAYGKKAHAFKTDAERVAFLFEQYQRLSSLLPAAAPARKRAVKRRPA